MFLQLKKAYGKWKGFKTELREHAKPAKRWLYHTIDLVETLGVALCLALLIKTFVVQTSKIPTGSMIPTLNPPMYKTDIETPNILDRIVTAPFPKFPSDWLLVNKVVYKFRSPKRGEIVVFKSPEINGKTEWVKRCAGLPGETIEVVSGKIYVNGNLIVFPGVQVRRDYSDFGPYTLPEDGYFMVGDNRAQSNDSRRWKDSPIIGRSFVRESELVGKAFFTFFPFSRMRVLR